MTDFEAELSKNRPTKIVAIGASAGGLEPFEKFFDNMSPDSDCSFVVIQHLSPDFRSMMGELLNRHSSMPILQAQQDLEIEPNTIYLNPARMNMAVKGGKFVLTPVTSRDTLHLPIDVFLTSLAEEQGANAVAIILSGTGSDGTKGVQAISNAGGSVLIQDPVSAKFDGMPEAAMKSVRPDAIATPQKLATIVGRLARGEPIADKTDDDDKEPADPETRVFEILHERFGLDFNHYKSATIQRRLTRRMDLLALPDMTRYVERLEADRNEADELYAEFLIDVTTFFRDSAAFSVLDHQVIPPLIDAMSATRQVRVWIPGCSTGQEAYSIAMRLAEEARKRQVTPNIKIIATDVHQRSVDAASFGVYSTDELSPVSEELRNRYFKQTGSNWQVRPFLRQMLAFSTHNVLSDPPFTRIDLVSCRNMLIYFKEVAQNKAIANFHFSLVKNGFLLLGPSETVGELSKEFDQIDQKWRLFSKKRDVRLAEAIAQLPLGGRGHKSRPTGSTMTSEMSQNRRLYDRSLDIVLKRYAPPGFLLKSSGEVVRIFGDASRFIDISEGDFSQQIGGLVRSDLHAVVSAALDRAKVPKTLPFERKIVVDEENGDRSHLTVKLESLHDREGDSEQLLLTIHEESRGRASAMALSPVEVQSDDIETVLLLRQRIEDLELQLTAAEETLQTTVEELETSNEELQATNEELMASNEELQSTNEELHSVNEELYTVSAEHQRKITELTELSSDMEHLLQSTGIGTIFVDEKLCVRRFTPAAVETFNLVEHDIGRPIAHITTRFHEPTLTEKLSHIIETGESVEQEIVVGDKTLLLRALPYKVNDEGVSGAVITMIDVTALKEAKLKVEELALRYENIVEDIDHFMMRWDANDGKITFCNDAFCKVTDRKRERILGRTLEEVIAPEQADKLIQCTGDLAIGDATNFLLEETETAGRPVCYECIVRAVADNDGALVEYQAVGQDITEATAYRVALEKLSRLTFDIDKPLKPSIREALTIGAEFFGMPLGVFSQIKDEEYKVEAIVGGDILGLQEGTVMPLKNTYCSDLKDPNKALAIASVPDSEFKDSTAYLASGLESYIGQKVRTGSEYYGAVNFAARKPRAPFGELEISLIATLAEWIGRRVERDAMSKDIARTRNDFDLILNSIRAKVFFKDDKNRILRLNEAAAASMGLTVEEATGGDTYKLFPEMAAKYHQDDMMVIESGKPLLQRVEKFTPKDAPELWVETDKIPYVDSETGERHLLAIARDITVEKEHEQKIRDLNRELSSNNERLETSNDSLRQFAHVASHDLQEPLRKLMQFSEYLVEDCGDELSEDGKFFVEVISGSAARMRTLVTDILSLSSTTGKELKRETLDLPAIVTDLKGQMDVRIAESNARIEVGTLPEITGDKTLVEQLLRNLISNGLKYKRADVAPVVEINGITYPDGRIQISVSDNGIGMEQKDAQRIFEPFTRLHNRDKFDGTGIGLAICRTVCERHGWHIDVDSTVGEGTKFMVRIPSSEEAAQ